MRYANLAIVLVFRLVSSKVKARFPDYDSLVDAKLLLPAEARRMVKAELQTPHEATWTPILWALKLLERARTEGKIKVKFRMLFEILKITFLVKNHFQNSHPNYTYRTRASISRSRFVKIICF